MLLDEGKRRLQSLDLCRVSHGVLHVQHDQVQDLPSIRNWPLEAAPDDEHTGQGCGLFLQAVAFTALILAGQGGGALVQIVALRSQAGAQEVPTLFQGFLKRLLLVELVGGNAHGVLLGGFLVIRA